MQIKCVKVKYWDQKHLLEYRKYLYFVGSHLCLLAYRATSQFFWSSLGCHVSKVEVWWWSHEVAT